MTSNSSKKENNRNDKFRDFSSPQIWLPSHLLAWPGVRIPKAPKSAPKPESGKKIFEIDKAKLVQARSYSASKSNDRPQSEKDSVSKSPTKNNKLSLSDEGESDAADTSSEKSSHDPAPENALAKERKGSNLVRKTNSTDDLSTGDEADLTDEISTDAKINSSELTLEDGSSERKDRMRQATASQKEDKSTGKKKHQERGGIENVFNARTPLQETSKTSAHKDILTPKPIQKSGKEVHTPSSENLTSRTKSVSKLQAKHGKIAPSQSPAKLQVDSETHSTSKDVPVRSRVVSPIGKKTTSSQATTTTRKKLQESSAALTEAQLQASLLRRSGHREFSSNAFKVPEENEDESDSEKASTSNVKKSKKSEYAESDLDPVRAEIARQQSSYNDYMVKRMKENPDHYSQKTSETIYELSSDEETDSEDVSEACEPSNGGTDEEIAHGGAGRRSAVKERQAHFETHECEAQSQYTLNKDGNNRKRKRDRASHVDENGTSEKRSRKKAKNQGKDKSEQLRVMERDDQSNTQRCVPSDGKDTWKGASNTQEEPSTQPAMTNSSTQKAISTQHRGRSASATRKATPRDPKDDTDFMTTLKSLWPILPKALLHATMVDLNRANRRSLNAKMKLCQTKKDKNQSDSNIRIVTYVNEDDEEIELIEENGTISEPDPHTMSSDMTLLTTAKNLIEILSGPRVGLDLSAIVMVALEERKKKKTASVDRHGTSTKARAGEVSFMEEQLARIAGEHQKEIENLKELNRVLMARHKRGKEPRS